MIGAIEKLDEGKRLLNANQLEQAEQLFAECCAQSPKNSEAWFLLGACCFRLNEKEQAMQAFERAIHFEPTNIAAYNAKANLLAELGQVDEALDVTLQALKAEPHNTKSLTNHASLLFQAGMYTESLDVLNQILSLEPRSTRALENRAVVFNRLGQAEESLTDALTLADVLPTVSPYILQASAHMALNRFQQAEAAAKHALSIESENIHSLVLLATAQAGLERYKEAEKSFFFAGSLDAKRLGEVMARQVLNLPPSMNASPLSLYLSLAEQRRKVCDWSNHADYYITLQSYLENIDRVSASDTDIKLLSAACFAGIDPLLQLQLAKFIAKDATKNVKKLTHEIAEKPERLKIGYLAKSFNKSVVTTHLSAMFEMHNRAEFEVYCYSLEPSDGSPANVKVKKVCDRFTEIYPHITDKAVEMIHDDGVHILVDLIGCEQQFPYDILARQVAPIQLGFAGMPFSSGADFIQYRLADNRVALNSADAVWSEKLLRLPDTHLIYQQSVVSKKLINREQYGLPEKGTVFCCFAPPDIIDMTVFKCWMNILERVEGSVLWVQDWGDEFRQNLRKEAFDHEIGLARLIFAPRTNERKEMLAQFSLVDIYLDTFTINDHDSVNDALWSGIPVLNLFKLSMASRMTASKLSVLDFPTLICSTEEEYIERAIYLATHAEYLGILKRKVERHVLSKPLFKTQQTVLNIEKAYQYVWQQYIRGNVPVAHTVEEE